MKRKQRLEHVKLTYLCLKAMKKLILTQVQAKMKLIGILLTHHQRGFQKLVIKKKQEIFRENYMISWTVLSINRKLLSPSESLQNLVPVIVSFTKTLRINIYARPLQIWTKTYQFLTLKRLSVERKVLLIQEVLMYFNSLKRTQIRIRSLLTKLDQPERNAFFYHLELRRLKRINRLWLRLLLKLSCK